MQEENANLYSSNVVACVWDFDKTLIDGYMQSPIFREYGVDESLFWKEVNMLPKIYAQKGVRVAPESVYLNHLLSFVKSGVMSGLSNAKLRKFGRELVFCDGLPNFFDELKSIVENNPEYNALDIKLEHYIISTGIAEMIRGSAIAEHVDGIFGCEFVEEPMPPYFSLQKEFDFQSLSNQINQIGMIVDNTIKTRFIFEINKGTNKNPEISVNDQIREKDRRVPIRNMIYIADGPSDVPVFSVVRKSGGKAFAVYSPKNSAEFEQNDFLLSSGRIDAYGPNVYTPESSTSAWLKMHVKKICDRILKEHSDAVENKIGKAPTHLHKFTPSPTPPSSPDLF